MKNKYYLIVFDFEVFRKNVLIGAYIIDESNNITKFQTWDQDEIREFYYTHRDNSIWLGWNNQSYDNFILQSIVQKKDPYQTSKEIIQEGNRYKYLRIPLYFYDLISNHPGSLKAIECADGKNIKTSDVDFNLDRELTDEEKLLTEIYNTADIDQTLDNFYKVKDEFQLRMDVIEEFGLSMDCLHVTGTQLAEEVLHAQKIEGIENWVVKPKLYDTLQLKNQQVIDFYLNEDFKKGKKLDVVLCGVPHRIGSGGIHAARPKYHTDWAFYLDCTGYYNHCLLDYDLLPRSIPDKYKAFYKYMFEEQVKLKKTNPAKRWVYKIILLSVFGAMTNKYCKFYDPYHGQLVTITGEIFNVDLLEKLEGKVELIQNNTDGLIAKPLPGVPEEEVLQIVKDWCARTKFEIVPKKIYNIHQRDVNCYMYQDEKGNVHTLGEALKHYNAWENSLYEDVYKSKEPVIIEYMLVDYFIYHKMPEQTVEEHKRQLRMFQYVCKKVSFDYLEYQKNFADGTVQLERLQAVNRAFAHKSDEFKGMVYKCRTVGKTTRAKVSNLPENVFIYDDEILSDEAYAKLAPMIDWQYYIDRGYERIREFIDLIEIKDFNI